MAFGIGNDFTGEENDGFKTLEGKKEEVITEKKVEAPKQDETIFKELETKKPVEKVDEKVETKKDDVSTIQELNDDRVLEYFNKKRKEGEPEYTSLDALYKVQEKEVEKVVNPWEDVLDDEDKAYLNYKKETGRDRKAFEFLSQDFSKVSPLELSRDKIRQDTGLQLTNAEADEYLERKLNVDLSDELSTSDRIELNAFVKPYKDGLIQQQEKYRKPLETALKNKADAPEMVQLNNGQTMPKAEYEQLLENRRIYTESVKEAVNSVAAFDFKIAIDDNGEKRDLDISYELSKEDKHSMLSDALDVDATIKREFQTEKGFNHSELAQTLYRGQEKNFNKIMTAMAEKVRAATIEELTSQSNNENFSFRPIDKVKTGKEGYGDFLGEQRKPGFGVKFG